MTKSTTERGRWAVAALFFVNGFVVGSLAPQIPLLMPRHDIGKPELGLLIFGLGIGAVAAMLFGGRLIAAFGSRRVSVTFAFAITCVLPFVAFAPTVATVALALAVMGAVLGSMDIAMNANAVEVEQGLGWAIMSSSHGFWSVGGFLGSGLGGLIVAQFDARVHALVVMAVTLAIVLVARRYLLDTSAGGARDAGQKRPALFPRDLGLWVLGAMALLSMVPEGAVLDWAAIYLGQDHGTGIAGGALAFALFSATMAVTRFLGDGIRNRFGAVRTLRVSALMAAAGLIVAAASPYAGLAIAGFAFAGIGVANMVPIMFSAAGNQPGHAPGVGIAAVTMMGYSGILLAPSSIGFAAEAVGFRVVFGTLSLLLVLVALLSSRAAMADGVRAP